jgi:UDP-glucose 4-epimerase
MLFITGALGFLGRHVIAELSRIGVLATAVTRRAAPAQGAATTIRIDSYRELVPPTAQSVLIHLAETADVAIADAMGEDHVGQTRAGLAALLRNGWAHVVYASSAVVYGDDAEHPRRTDEPTPVPVSPYARAKLECEELTLAAGGSAARLSNIYGPGMARNCAVGQIVAQIPGEGPLWVRDRAPVRDFLWVTDAAAGLVALAQKRAAGIYNLGTGRGTSIGELAHTALAAGGQAERRLLASAPVARRSCRVLDVSETLAKVSWRAETSLPQGLSHIVKLNP